MAVKKIKPVPPKEYQYKKGQTGNPNGRPKGGKNISTYLKLLMDEEMSTTDMFSQKKSMKKTVADIIAVKLIALAIKSNKGKGDLAAINTIMDRLEGKPLVKQETKTQFEEIEVKIVKATNPSD
jgi:hypothetical protein